MVSYKIKKLWHGSASVRDYVVKDTINKKEDLQIILLEPKEIMIVPWQELDKGKQCLEKFHSKHNGGQIYSLIDFPWKPGKDLQATIFDFIKK